mgnify:CR=1 FL=1
MYSVQKLSWQLTTYLLVEVTAFLRYLLLFGHSIVFQDTIIVLLLLATTLARATGVVCIEIPFHRSYPISRVYIFFLRESSLQLVLTT